MTLLTAAEFGSLVSTGLSEDALDILLLAAEAEIVRFAGPSDAVTELVHGGQRFITLARQADSITSISETLGTDVTTLETDDYLLYPDGYRIERLQTGTNGRWRWWGRVSVIYAPIGDEDIRRGVERDLVALMLNYQPGLTSETVGSWTTQLAGNSAWNNNRERESILSRLVTHGRMLVVGG